MTDTQKKTVLDAVKMLLGIESEDIDARLSWHISSVGRRILNYCNIDVMPDGAIEIWADMTMRVAKADGAIRTLLGVEEQVVSSVSLGDTSVSFKQRSEDKTLTADELILSYAAQLSRFRRLKW